MPDAPGPVPSWRALSVEQRVHLGPAHQRQGQERQRPALGDGRGELGAVADARHRSLHDRVARAVRPASGASSASGGRACAARRRRRRASVSPATMPPTVSKRRARSAAKAASWPSGTTRSSSESQPTRCPTSAARRPPAPTRTGGAPRARAGPAGCRPAAACRAGAQDGRLAAVHRRDPGTDRLRQRRLARQQQLAVEDGARRPGNVGRGNAVQPDPSGDPYGHRGGSEQALQQHERALLADPAAGLVALGDQRVRSGGLSGLCLLEAGGDCVHAQPRCLGVLHEDRELRLVGGRDEDALEAAELRRQQRRQQLVIVDEHSPGPAAQLGERGQLRKRGVAIDGQLEIEHPERARTAPRDRDSGVGRAGLERGR